MSYDYLNIIEVWFGYTVSIFVAFFVLGIVISYIFYGGNYNTWISANSYTLLGISAILSGIYESFVLWMKSKRNKSF